MAENERPEYRERDKPPGGDVHHTSANDSDGAGKGATRTTQGDRKGGDLEPQTTTGADAVDTGSFAGRAGGRLGDQLPADDSGIQPQSAEALTEDGGLALDGGKLPGNRDSFEGDLDADVKSVPGAGDDANEGLSNDRTSETGNPDRAE
jgi:hypothetical protein